MNVRHFLLGGLAAFALQAALAAPASALVTGDWPCIQGKVAALQPGQMWSGPSIEAIGNDWREDREVSRLVPLLAARRTPMEDATAEIEKFAAAAGEAKQEKLTLLFAGLFQRINTERTRVVNGIERYARKQRELSEDIKGIRDTLLDERGTARAPKDEKVGGPQVSTAAAGAPVNRFASPQDERLYWETRIYDERNRALTYVCDSPVILDQRIFALARAIQNELR